MLPWCSSTASGRPARRGSPSCRHSRSGTTSSPSTCPATATPPPSRVPSRPPPDVWPNGWHGSSTSSGWTGRTSWATPSAAGSAWSSRPTVEPGPSPAWRRRGSGCGPRPGAAQGSVGAGGWRRPRVRCNRCCCAPRPYGRSASRAAPPVRPRFRTPPRSTPREHRLSPRATSPPSTAPSGSGSTVPHPSAAVCPSHRSSVTATGSCRLRTCRNVPCSPRTLAG